MKKGVSIIINILLFAVIVFLAWQVVKSIQAPIKFTAEKDTREAQVKERLIDIRNAEVFYKQAHNKYTDNFDSLILFCQTDSLPIVGMRTIKSLDSEGDTVYSTEIDTLRYISILDSIRNSQPDKNSGQEGRLLEFDINKIKYVPFAENNEIFELEAGSLSRNGLDIPVFQARTPYEVYLAKPSGSFSEKEWNQRRDNAKAEKESLERYPGLQIGSMTETTTEGNWSKEIN